MIFIKYFIDLISVHLLINWSFLLLGLFDITLGSAGLKDKAVAGNPSVTKLTHNNYIELKPSGIPKTELKNILTTSPIFEDIMYLIKAYNYIINFLNIIKLNILKIFKFIFIIIYYLNIILYFIL